MTRIIQVEYRELRSHGTFANTTIGAVATVEDDEDPKEALSDLRAWVGTELDRRVQAVTATEDARRALTDVEYKLQQRKRDLERLHTRWERARGFLERHGVTVPDGSFMNTDDIPF